MWILGKEEMYAADRYTIHQLGVPDEMLMENAGQVMVELLRPRLRRSDQIIVLAGGGNNGGDGIVIARRLQGMGYNAQLLLTVPEEKVSGAAGFHLALYRKHGYCPLSPEKGAPLLMLADWIVDALLGIGVSGQLRPPADQLIRTVNASPAKVFAADLPSGISADGSVCAEAVNADITAMVAYPKIAAYTYPAAAHFGEIKVADIGIHLPETPRRQTWGGADCAASLPRRRADAHKGDAGKVLLVGGSENMFGAPLLAAKACLLAGTGLLQLAVPSAAKPAAVTLVPEATYAACTEQDGAIASVDIPTGVNALACGPGLSRVPAVGALVEQMLHTNLPLVLDADALFGLDPTQIRGRKAPTVLTPHAGEMARLCGCSAAAIQANRFGISREKAMEWGCVLVLKGPHTIVTLPDGRQFVNTSGNAGLAKGGSGDILTGILAAFLPCHKTVQQAVSNAVYVHGRAADLLLQRGRTTRDLTAHEVAEALPLVFAELEDQQKDSAHSATGGNDGLD